MTDISTAFSSAMVSTTTTKASFVDAFSRAFSDCMAEEFDLLVADAIDDIGAKKHRDAKRDESVEGRNEDDVQDRDEDTKDLVTEVKDQENVSYLPSVGTTLHNKNGGTTFDEDDDEDDIDDDKSDLLSEREALMRIPSKIAFKPMRGKSFALGVRASDLGLVREGDVSEVLKPAPKAEAKETVRLNKKETRKQRRSRRKEMKQLTSRMTKSIPTIFEEEEDRDQAEVVVQARDGVEIMATQNRTTTKKSQKKKTRRWSLGKRFRAGKSTRW